MPESSSISLNVCPPIPPPDDRPTVLSPPDPPPLSCLDDFPPGSLAHEFIHPFTPTVKYIGYHDTPKCLHLSSSPLNSAIHMVRSPRVCGINSNDTILVTVTPMGDTCPLIDGGSNICVTEDLNLLVDLIDTPPVAISVALDGAPLPCDDTITKRGLLPLTLSDGTTYYQPCYYCANMIETIISPAAVLATSDQFFYWTQVGCKDPTMPGSLHFTSRDGGLSMTFDLEYREGLYHCTTDVYTVGVDPAQARCHCTVAPKVPDVRRTPSKFSPTSKAQQVESEVWMLCFGSPGEHQLDVLPLHVIGTPPVFEYHPFRYIDFKEQAYICKQTARRTSKRIPTCGAELNMNFGFMRSSTNDYKRPNKATDLVVTLYDGYSAHLVIVDGASRWVWVEPPINILRAFYVKIWFEKGSHPD
jgi:hypothetical protein